MIRYMNEWYWYGLFLDEVQDDSVSMCMFDVVDVGEYSDEEMLVLQVADTGVGQPSRQRVTP